MSEDLQSGAPGEEVGAEPGMEARDEALTAQDGPAEIMQPASPDGGRSQEGPRVGTILEPPPAQQTRDLNDAVHHILVIGLIVSAALLIAGLVLALAQGSGLPPVVLGIGPAIVATLALKPAGLISLGLIALIATPIVRVIGSVIVFMWERDWLYVAVTLTVLLVMAISVMVGRG